MRLRVLYLIVRFACCSRAWMTAEGWVGALAAARGQQISLAAVRDRSWVADSW